MKIQIYYSHILVWSLFTKLSMSKIENFQKIYIWEKFWLKIKNDSNASF